MLQNGYTTVTWRLHGGYATVIQWLPDCYQVYDHLDVAEMHALVRNLSGLGDRIFVPDATFRMLVVQHIAEYESVCQQCVELVQEELRSLVTGFDVAAFQAPPFARRTYTYCWYYAIRRSRRWRRQPR